MTTFQEEKFSEIKSEIFPLMLDHWNEVTTFSNQFSLEPNFEQYFKLESLSFYKLFTARKDNKIIGYAAFLIFPSMKFQNTLLASADGFWVAKGSRGMGSIALRLIRFTEQKLREIGVKAIQANHPEDAPKLGRLLEFEKYVPHERIFVKVLSNA